MWRSWLAVVGSSAVVCVCVFCEFASQYVCLMKATSGVAWSWALSPGEEAGASGDPGGRPHNQPQEKGGLWRSQRCCQDSSHITSVEPLISTTQHAISNCSQVCFKTRRVDRNKSREPQTDTWALSFTVFTSIAFLEIFSKLMKSVPLRFTQVS